MKEEAMRCGPRPNLSESRHGNERNVQKCWTKFPERNWPSAWKGGLSPADRPGRPPLQMAKDLPESFDRCGLVVFHVEDGIELGDLQQVTDFLREMEKL